MSSRGSRIVALVFALLGMGALSASYFFGRKQIEILQSWPVVTAEVVNSEITSKRDSDDNSTLYGAEVTFRFAWNGSEATATGDRGYRSSSYNSMRRVVEKFAPGTRHPLWVNPQNPADVRFNAGYSLEFFGVPLFVAGFGLVFFVVAIAAIRKKDFPYATSRPGQCPTCRAPVPASEKFCPKCGTMLHEG